MKTNLLAKTMLSLAMVLFSAQAMSASLCASWKAENADRANAESLGSIAKCLVANDLQNFRAGRSINTKNGAEGSTFFSSPIEIGAVLRSKGLFMGPGQEYFIFDNSGLRCLGTTPGSSFPTLTVIQNDCWIFHIGG